MNNWKVMKNPVGDAYIWQVYRIKNQNEPMHSGNIETTGKIYTTEEEAQTVANNRNLDVAIEDALYGVCKDYCKYSAEMSDENYDDITEKYCDKCPMSTLYNVWNEMGVEEG